jgi:hypothetical protein
VSANRKRKLDACAAPPELTLYDFIVNVNKNYKKVSPQEVLLKHQVSIQWNSIRIINLNRFDVTSIGT